MINIDEGGLVSTACEEVIPITLRAQSLILLREQDGEGWLEVQSLAVHVFVQTLNFDELSSILLDNDIAIPSHPHETLIVAHLLSASHVEEHWKKAREARKKALQVVQSTDVPESIGDDEYKLLLLLEGRIEESVSKLELTDSLSKNGIKAINQIVNALSSGGSHLVDEKFDLGTIVNQIRFKFSGLEYYNEISSQWVKGTIIKINMDIPTTYNISISTFGKKKLEIYNRYRHKKKTSNPYCLCVSIFSLVATAIPAKVL